MKLSNQTYQAAAYMRLSKEDVAVADAKKRKATVFQIKSL